MVKRISPVREVHPPKGSIFAAHDASTTDFTYTLQPRDVNYPIGSNDVPHSMTGVDKLREEGLLGSGIRVAVVDDGVDYKHPALGGCYGDPDKCLISFGYDLIKNTTDPYYDCFGHGTHVSGLIAARTNLYNFTGVAPKVTLGHYKVRGCNQSATTELLMSAFKLAVQDKADVITCSMGSYSGWSEEPWGVLIQNITDSGIPCMVAVGNDGYDRMFYASAGADGKGAIGVGSVDNLMTPMILVNARYSYKQDTKQFGWTVIANHDFANGTYNLHPLNSNSSVQIDACEGLSSNTPDLSKYIVLIRVGGCSFHTKVENAVKAGAKNILFYNNGPGTYDVDITYSNIGGMGMVPATTGEEWVKLAAKDIPINLHMVAKASASTFFAKEVNKASGGYVHVSSEWGPTNDLAISPHILAPGGFMLSTWPVALGGFAVLSGSSMAAPYLAGCIALLLESRGKPQIQTIQSLLAATAKPKQLNDGVSTFPFLSPVAQQGAGLVDVYDAIHSTVVLNVSSLSFNDTQFLAPAWFSITNNGTGPANYSIGQVSCGTVYTLASDGTTIPEGISYGHFMQPVNSSALLNFSSTSVSISQGQTVVVKVMASPFGGLNASRIPIYSGYVTLNSTNGDSFSIPYLGAATVMRNVTILDTKHGKNYLMSSDSTHPVQSGQQFTFVNPGVHNKASNVAYPIFDLVLSMGTRLIQGEVLSENRTLLGSLPNYPQNYISRTVGPGTNVSWKGELPGHTCATGNNCAPAGVYSLRMRALRIFGEPNSDLDYDVVETPQFRIQYSGT
ncbi:hypothetical protein N7456_006465 [Penicillium angulare]|uniref:Uncharacterized protein n=1 Tax=Penicillium angulare TaxID=116970 RepID=A0A9W9FHW0_9EURO|nr:hypothetical protein N7456_006465 [Penicillium angulare]